MNTVEETRSAPDTTTTTNPSTSSAGEAAGFVDHPKYDPSSGLEDYDKASDLKQKAADAKDNGDYEKALKLYNEAIVIAPPSALMYANRAYVLEQLGYYSEAAEDCTNALEQNPDSAKAYKIRGKLRYKHLDDWHGALSDLNQAQAIDFDPDIATLLKELTELRKEEEHAQALERLEQEEKARKRAQEIKQAQAEAAAAAKAEAAAAAAASGGGGGFRGTPGMGGGMGGMGGMPGMGMPGGMDPSMMAGLMSDPDLQEAMKNPKVMSALQDLMSGPGGPMGLLSNPGKLQQLMTDPDVGPVLQKLMSKFMGGGGMGGMPGGAFGGGGGGRANHDDDDGFDDIPDMEAMD